MGLPVLHYICTCMHAGIPPRSVHADTCSFVHLSFSLFCLLPLFVSPFFASFCHFRRLHLSVHADVPALTHKADALLTTAAPFFCVCCCCGSFQRHYHHTTTSSVMDSGYPRPSGITVGSPGLPPGSLGSPFPEQMNSPHSSDAMQGSNASQVPLTMHADGGQHSKPHSPPLTSGAEVLSAPHHSHLAGVNAPWDEDDDWTTPGAPAQHSASAAAPAKLPLPPGNHAAPPVSIAEQTNPGSPAEPHPTPVAMSPPPSDGFIASSSPGGSPNRPPTPPEKPSAANVAKMDALKKQIASRTAAMDAATKEKETKIMTAAQEYLKALMAKREEEVMNAKASHKEEQQVGAEKINEYKRSGAVWSAVGLLVDLQKPNQYSKSTEQMRTVLSTLNAAPAKK
ncbi:Clathrin light chain, putative [Leishmania donovani]|uniref:Clathrin light chain, putative n=2 Tax=Leishmania donovani TaxID=5661 RepID=A0A3S5H749_LEIDO|nr:Clathrin light chain, putative [Leishmania donovani]